MNVVSINITNAAPKLREAMGRMLRKANSSIRVIQLEQIAAAFNNSGQPGAKWAPLWANTFKGKVAQKNLEALSDAHTGLFKAINAFRKASDAKALAGMRRVGKSQARLAKAGAAAVAAESYRKGGKPLQDNGFLKGSFFTKHAFVFESEGTAIIVAASNAVYAPWHQTGFKTKGPNFIPLTLKARRHHQLHQNPTTEGLEEGVDYIMAWHGVDVPARPIIDYADPVNKKQISEAIRLAFTPKG